MTLLRLGVLLPFSGLVRAALHGGRQEFFEVLLNLLLYHVVLDQRGVVALLLDAADELSELLDELLVADVHELHHDLQYLLLGLHFLGLILLFLLVRVTFLVLDRPEEVLLQVHRRYEPHLLAVYVRHSLLVVLGPLLLALAVSDFLQTLHERIPLYLAWGLGGLQVRLAVLGDVGD